MRQHPAVVHRTSMSREVVVPLLLALLGGAFLAACGDATKPPKVATIAVSPSAVVLRPDQTTRLLAQPRDAGGAPIDRAVQWTSSNNTVAAVSLDGVVTGVGLGTATITASAEGMSGAASITVSPVPVATVVLAPATVRRVPLQTTQLVATLTDSAGQPATNRTIAWSSSLPTVANVSASGLVTALSAGTTIVTATSEGRSGTALVTVVAPTLSVSPSAAAVRIGQTARLVAQVRDADGAVVDRQVQWSSSDVSVATVAGDGLVTTLRIGTATITAAVDGATASATVAVSAIPVASVMLAPATIRRVPQQSAQLIATLTDSTGQPATNRTIAWSTSASDIASVSTTGLVTTGGIGTVIITATSEGRSGTALITVVAPTLTIVESPVVPWQGTTTITAVVRDADGAVLTDRTPTWSSSDTLAVRVSSAGLLTGVSRERPPAIITARLLGAQASMPMPVALTFTSLSAGSLATACGIGTDGSTWCWGANTVGNVGDGTRTDRASPVRVMAPPGVVFATIAVGPMHTCARTANGAAWCWGSSQGSGSGTNGTLFPLPVRVQAPSGVTFASLTAGSGTTCGLTPLGAAYCWGFNAEGQLGTGTAGGDLLVPALVAGGLTFGALETNMDHSCGIATSGVTYCWGSNRTGALGDGSFISRSAPTPLVTSAPRFVRLSRGAFAHACAITASGQVYCWGEGIVGQLGDGTLTTRPTPGAVASSLSFSTVDGGAGFTCGRTTTNLAYCWGLNADGRLGDGTTLTRTTPTAVAGNRVFTQVIVGGTFACGLTPPGFAYCWGSNANGQIGDGDPSPAPRLAPVVVR
jgi:alpha-tubulin suppressor-like RCC1 family protein/uncharacterized protein YjdB